MTKQESQQMPNIQCAEDITLLSLLQVCALAKCWNVNMSGLRHKKDIEEKLIKLWLSHRKEEKSDSWELTYLASAFKEHQKTQQSLIDIYLKAEKVYNYLAHHIKWEYNNVSTLIKEKKDSLKSGECTIVIAGEVGAGKTSLLNLILETQIFPVDSLKCTNTILEIRSKSLDGTQEFKNCVDQSDDNPYDRCEVFYPFKILGVDTPGIDGWGNIDQRLQTYFSRASGFIYVINMITAAADQQSRLLSHLLKTVVNSSEDFSPKASLFIGNKWEHVPERDRVVVQKDIFYKVNQVYPGIRQMQIHYMSVKKAAEFKMKYETTLEEYKILMFKVSRLVSSSLRQGMVSYYWWLTLLLSRSLYLLRETCGHQAMTHEEQYRDPKWLRKHFDDVQVINDSALKRNVFLELEDDRMMYKLPNLVNEIAELLGQLDIFYINDIMKFDFELSELEWQNKMELGNGRFAKVYKSKLTRNNRPIAIKVATDVVDQSNVRQILNEDRIMRDLKHANIVRYYGASYIKTKRGLQWIIVMELCQTTLKQIYTGKLYSLSSK
ncbi:uncharacterized protein LOC132731570 [Ruditapes philippinarum]|uniref:uncharacterized protein LOC132731570 n=1 Tax=Ruditapes philippinarum TaxID=129788 RepID=UPI00295AD0EA|nr:uncharacterized protein LOC132731570 [Ruditapes philippinarum]